MGLLDIFRKKENPQVNNQTKQIDMRSKLGGITIDRADGETWLDIVPMRDKAGNQMYKTIYNMESGEVQNIEWYRVYNENLARGEAGKLVYDIYMPIQAEMLNNPQYRNIIANLLLSHKRLDKVEKEYNGYTGKIKVDERGKIRPEVDMSIVRTLDWEERTNESTMTIYHNNAARGMTSPTRYLSDDREI